MKTKIIFTVLLLGVISTSLFSQKIVWKPKAALPIKNCSGSAVTCQDKIYFMGGQIDYGSGASGRTNRMFEYDLVMDEWIEKPNMLTARFNMALSSVDDKIYAIGGDAFLDNNEMYDPTTEIWQTLAPMPTARQHIKAAVVGNKIYIIGGLESWSEVSIKNEVYDPQTDTWEEKASIPTPKHNYSTAVYNDKIYIFGGSTKNDGDIWVKTSTVDVYDPATNTWDTSSSLPSVRFNPGIGLMNDKIIITGGFAGDEVTTNVDFFDPVTSLWSQGNSLPKKNVAMGSTTKNNKIYIIGGSDGPPVWNGYNTVYEGTINESDNLIPELYYPLADDSCEVNEILNWTLPDFTFVDDDTLSYSASLTNGNDLPTWLFFNNDNGTFTGTPEKEDTLAIIITAVDNYEANVSDTFMLVAFKLVVESPTGIDQFTNEDDLLVFPNPAINYIQVQARDHDYKFENFQILTIDGKIIKEGSLESERINISDLNKGIFLLNIKTDEGIITKKIIVE